MTQTTHAHVHARTEPDDLPLPTVLQIVCYLAIWVVAILVAWEWMV